MTPELPANVAQLIEKEALPAYPEDIINLEEYPFAFDGNIGNRSIYVAGATAQALKANKLVEALEKIRDSHPHETIAGDETKCRKCYAINALKQYNEPI